MTSDGTGLGEGRGFGAIGTGNNNERAAEDDVVVKLGGVSRWVGWRWLLRADARVLQCAK
jgi:hypothetical protein